MADRILIVGATGNIGSALVAELQRRKGAIFAGVRQTGKEESLGVPTILFDFEKPETMKEAFAKVDRAFLLLPLAEKMVEYGVRAVDAAKEASLSFLLKSSELGADPNSSKIALRAQGTVDQYLKNSDIPWAILCPNFFMQNFALHYAPTIRERGGIFLPQGSGKISFIDVRDIAAVAAEILLAPNLHKGRAYNLTGPQALSNQEVALQLSAVVGKVVEYHPVGDEVAIEAMTKRGVSNWISEFVMSLHRHVREGQMEKVSSAVQEIIGRPPMDFAKFALDHTNVWGPVEEKTSNLSLNPDLQQDNAASRHGLQAC